MGRRRRETMANSRTRGRKPKPGRKEIKARKAADSYRDTVFARTGLKADDLVCPREKSSMTPCIARDGGLAVAFTASGKAICVGCESGVEFQIQREKERA